MLEWGGRPREVPGDQAAGPQARQGRSNEGPTRMDRVGGEEGVLSWSIARAPTWGVGEGYSEIPQQGSTAGARMGNPLNPRVDTALGPGSGSGGGVQIRVNPTWIQLRDPGWESSCSRGS